MHINHLSPKLIQTYLSSLKPWIEHGVGIFPPLLLILVLVYVRAISIISQFSPMPNCVCDLQTLTLMFQTCDLLSNAPPPPPPPPLAFFGFFFKNVITTHSKENVTETLLGHAIILYVLAQCAPKMDKDNTRKISHFCSNLSLPNHILCLARAVSELLESSLLAPQHRLYAHNVSPLTQ